MSSHSLQETLLHVRKLLLDLERHLDRAAEAEDVAEVGRAWVRSAQVERALRAAVPPEAMEVAKAEEGADAWEAPKRYDSLNRAGDR